MKFLSFIFIIALFAKPAFATGYQDDRDSILFALQKSNQTLARFMASSFPSREEVAISIYNPPIAIIAGVEIGKTNFYTDYHSPAVGDEPITDGTNKLKRAMISLQRLKDSTEYLRVGLGKIEIDKGWNKEASAAELRRQYRLAIAAILYAAYSRLKDGRPLKNVDISLWAPITSKTTLRKRILNEMGVHYSRTPSWADCTFSVGGPVGALFMMAPCISKKFRSVTGDGGVDATVSMSF